MRSKITDRMRELARIAAADTAYPPTGVLSRIGTGYEPATRPAPKPRPAPPKFSVADAIDVIEGAA